MELYTWTFIASASARVSLSDAVNGSEEGRTRGDKEMK